jgi:hypothetical protein
MWIEEVVFSYNVLLEWKTNEKIAATPKIESTVLN